MRKKHTTTKYNQNKKLGVFLFGFFLLITSTATAATVSFSGSVLDTGETDITTTVSLANPTSDDISSINFTLDFDDTKITYVSVSASANLNASGKSLVVNEYAAGELRGVIYGLNSDQIVAGELFTISFTRVNGSPDSIVTPSLSEFTVSSSTGTDSGAESSVGAIYLGNTVLGNSADVPTISNNDSLVNQSNFQLNWSDESASGATSYVVTKMPLASVTPLDYGTGLISYWPLNEASGSALDGQGSNDLVDVNTVIQSDDRPFGIVNGSRFFMAANQNEMTIAKDAQTGLDFGSTMTLSAWVKPNSLGDMTVINNWYEPGVDERSYRLAVREDGSLEGTVSSDGVERVTAKSPAGTIQAGVWQQVAFTVDVNQTNDPFTDSMNNHTINVGGATFDQSDYAIGEGSANVTNSYMTVPNSPDWDLLANDFTIDFWIKPSSFGDDHKIMAMSNNPNNYWQISFFGGSGENIRFDSKVNGAGYMYIVAQNHGMSANQWHHVAFVRSGTEAFVYINGVDQTNYYGNMTAGTPNFDAPLYIGGSNFGPKYKGKIDEVRFVQGEATYSGNFTPTAHSPGLQNDNTKLFLRFGISDELKLYKDGAEISNVVELEDVEPNLVDSSEPFRIGAGNGGSEYFDGKIADVACWARVLASSELSGLSFGDRETVTTAQTQYQYSDLEDGSYLFFVQSKTDTDVLSAFSDSFQVTLDTVAPTVPVILSPESLLANTTFVISGTCAGDSDSIEVVCDDGSVTVGAVTLNATTWSSSITVPNDGVYSLSVAAYDEAGNMSDVAASEITIDTTAPVFTFTAPDSMSYTVPLKLVNFIGSLDDNAVEQITFTYGNQSDVVTVSNGNFNFYHNLSPGTNLLYLTAEDAAGNQTVETFTINYSNNLPLVFNGLTNYPVDIDENVNFTVSIENQAQIEAELLTFSASSLPGAGSNNPASFNTSTLEFDWTPNSEQTGVYDVTFTVADDNKSTSQTIYILVQNVNYSDNDLNVISTLPGDHQAIVLDFDKDGFEDIYQVIHGQDKMYHNQGDGTFTEVATSIGLTDANSLGNSVVAVDINDDTYLDLYVVNDGANQIFINNQDGTFSDDTDSYGVGDTGEGKASLVEDFDNDGDLDILVLNNGVNTFLENNGNNTFTDQTILSNIDDNADSINALCHDFDGDGLKDIYIVNEGQNILYHNQGSNVFADESANITGDNNYSGFRSVLRDIDMDGDMDIMLINSIRDVIYRNDGNFTFNEILLNKDYNASTHNKYGLLLDFDSDDDLDLYVVDVGSKLVGGFGNVLFQNDGDGTFANATASSQLF